MHIDKVFLQKRFIESTGRTDSSILMALGFPFFADLPISIGRRNVALSIQMLSIQTDTSTMYQIIKCFMWKRFVFPVSNSLRPKSFTFLAVVLSPGCDAAFRRIPQHVLVGHASDIVTAASQQQCILHCITAYVMVFFNEGMKVKARRFLIKLENRLFFKFKGYCIFMT